VDLEWTAPESDGGSHITGYVVIYGSTAAHRVLYSREFTEGQATGCTLTDKLCPGITYQFAVAAKSKLGCGEFSDFSLSFTSPADSGTISILACIACVFSQKCCIVISVCLQYIGFILANV